MCVCRCWKCQPCGLQSLHAGWCPVHVGSNCRIGVNCSSVEVQIQQAKVCLTGVQNLLASVCCASVCCISTYGACMAQYDIVMSCCTSCILTTYYVYLYLLFFLPILLPSRPLPLLHPSTRSSKQSTAYKTAQLPNATNRMVVHQVPNPGPIVWTNARSSVYENVDFFSLPHTQYKEQDFAEPGTFV